MEEATKTLDLRNLPPFERHGKIFEWWKALGEEETLRIINDHDPKPLYYQFKAEYDGQFKWSYEQKGPRDWRVKIKKIQGKKEKRKTSEEKIEQLKQKLRAINEGKVDEEEAKEFFRKVTPLEISLAEQKLLEEGLDSQKLRDYCDLHLQALEPKKEELFNKLPSGNPIKIAISEHDEILKFLDKLEEITEQLQKKKYPEGYQHHLLHIAEHLMEAEKHHEREEKVLFPRLEERGITGPPRIMKEDHESLRPKKARLRELAKKLREGSEEEKELINLSFQLIRELRDHIFKENNILYPTFVEKIKDKEEWRKIREEFDEIGYCCFTPET